MKIDKKKLVFASIIVIVLIFIVSYTMLVFREEDLPATLGQPLVPELKEEQKEYTSKIDALDDLKEERERIIPSVYADSFLDSLEAYAPAIEEEEEVRIIDSTYYYPDQQVDYRHDSYSDGELEASYVAQQQQQGLPAQPVVAIEDLAAGHAEFFLSQITIGSYQDINSDQEFKAEVNSTQTVRTGDRLELILTEDAKLMGEVFPKNTVLYGFVNLQHNRLNIKITHISGKEIRLAAYDLQDSNEGIYVENSIRAEAGREVLDEVVQDINIGGLPQLGGLKDIFRKSNKRIKVTVLDQYQLVLKPEK